MSLGRNVARAARVCAVASVAVVLAGAAASSRDSATPANGSIPGFDHGLDSGHFVTVRVGKGDTLMEMLVTARVPRAEAHEAITALRKVYDPRGLMPGQAIEFHFMPGRENDGPGAFLGLKFEPSAERAVTVARAPDDRFKATEIEKKLSRKLVRAAGAIRTSLYVDALKAGIPAAVVVETIRAYSFDVDFQRDIRRDDTFEVMYERLYDGDGRHARNGDVIYAALSLSGATLRLYRYEPSKGAAEYFNEKGESVRKALMRTPIDGARLSSRYGRRRHPILGYTRMHQGVDFAAPSGTPVMAAGDGVIVSRGLNGNYGRYVRIRHNSTYATAYAHLRGYARGITRGKRVRQGQIIAYVGSSGLSTGPHLHYEVLVNGRRINPLKLRLPSGRKLEGRELDAFMKVKAETERRLAELSPATRTVGNE